MNVKPIEITKRSSLWKLALGFDKWEGGTDLLVNILDYLHLYHAEEFPTHISKDLFIKEAIVIIPRNIEQELQNFQEQGYVVIEGNSITFTEKFLASWQETHEAQEYALNIGGAWSWNC